MRQNFSALTPLAAAAAIVLPGGNANAAPVDGTDVFKACAAGALATEGLKPATLTMASGGHAGKDPLIGEASMGIDRLAPLTIPDGNGGLIRCAGSTSIGMHFRLRSGSYMETPPIAIASYTPNSGSEKIVNHKGWDIKVTDWRFSLAQACRSAFRHKRDSVGLSAVREITYEEGDKKVSRTFKQFLAQLTCLKGGVDMVPVHTTSSQPTVE